MVSRSLAGSAPFKRRAQCKLHRDRVLTPNNKQQTWCRSAAFESYVAHSAVLALKVLVMAPLTARQRYKNKAFANPEDAVTVKGKVKLDDPDVERVRRAHLNDLENIPAFWVVGALYLTTAPAPEVATWLFRAFTAGRVLHTIVYAVCPLPQPARAISFFASNLVTWYMGGCVALHYMGAL